ncbi:MAG: CZB domain-containing protein [Sulfuricurvum sp.]|uniref:CZB domain-containing protein n=1 Tax=Sulfuricurvum sp. TaxID=2025608 RepID=UPI0026238E2F|nr:CZB domain-containing protein [Sulfuricurvum sp.]MDD5159548.1 CZB domain-containing protein [Sulfuricurvum sp.]
MDKAVTLQLLSDAKRAHMNWVQRAQLLIDGLPIDKDAIPLSCSDCEFGQWLYREGEKITALGNIPYIGDIEKVHFDLHDHYMKIFRIYFADDNRSFLSKLLNSKKKISDQGKEMAKEYFSMLQATSEELLTLIGKLERRLRAIPESTFNVCENTIEAGM